MREEEREGDTERGREGEKVRIWAVVCGNYICIPCRHRTLTCDM